MVNSLRVELGAGADGWYLESIILQNVKNTQAGTSGDHYSFIYEGWMSNKDGDHANPRTVTLTPREGNV